MSVGLVGDVGGTNARFALADLESVRVARTWPTRDVPPLPEVYRALAARVPNAPAAPQFACLAVAAPVQGPSVTLTNADVTFDVRTLGTPHARLANDLEAAAAGIPEVPPEACHRIVDGRGHAHRPMVVVGLGTGLGVAIRLPSGLLISGEGGHAPFAPGNADLAELSLALSDAHARPVEWEDLLCGRGFGRIVAWCRGDRAAAVGTDIALLEQTAASACLASDAAAYTLFGGGVADLVRGLALTVYAGSVVLCGGVAGHLRPAFERPVFAKRFRAPGPVSHVLDDVSVQVVTDESLALRGCIRLSRGWYTDPLPDRA